MAIAVNLIGFDLDLTSKPAQTEAYITGSTVTLDGGTLSILASDDDPATTSQPRIIAITGAGGFATEGDSNAGAGMIAVNDIQDSTSAYIEGSRVTGPDGSTGGWQSRRRGNRERGNRRRRRSARNWRSVRYRGGDRF